jgi:hypothetical protein
MIWTLSPGFRVGRVVHNAPDIALHWTAKLKGNPPGDSASTFFAALV